MRGVHDFRKALRRARAVVSLLTPALGKKSARAIREELRNAFQRTGALRDASVLAAALDAVPPEPGEESPRGELHEEFAAAEARSRAEAAETLAAALRVVRPVPGALRVLLDTGYSPRDLERGLARGRRRERRALALALETRELADFHEWRKRVKELRYEIELLASTGTPPLKRREKRLAELAQELGQATDTIVLAGEIARHASAGGGPAAAALSERIRRLAAERAAALLDRGTSLFDHESDPKDFARRVLGERG